MGHELRVYKTTLRNQPLARAYSDSVIGTRPQIWKGPGLVISSVDAVIVSASAQRTKAMSKKRACLVHLRLGTIWTRLVTTSITASASAAAVFIVCRGQYEP